MHQSLHLSQIPIASQEMCSEQLECFPVSSSDRSLGSWNPIFSRIPLIMGKISFSKKNYLLLFFQDTPNRLWWVKNILFSLVSKTIHHNFSKLTITNTGMITCALTIFIRNPFTYDVQIARFCCTACSHSAKPGLGIAIRFRTVLSL